MAVDRRIPELPEKFILRRQDQVADMRDKIYLYFWHLALKGHVQAQSEALDRHQGSMYAIDWLSGIREDPPGFHAPKFRIIEDLREVMAITELAVNDQLGRWESTVRGGRGGADEYFDRNEAFGALRVYAWARREYDLTAFDLMPEEARAARRYFEQKHPQRVADEQRSRAA